MNPFTIKIHTTPRIPIVISVPHCGTDFPEELKDTFKQDLIENPADTDWFVDKLYDFAPSMGITMITANYSRWIIDLNRDPASKPLYADGRIITNLCPTTTFLGEFLYKDERNEVAMSEVQDRLNKYYWPYHLKLRELLEDVKSEFGKVLLWDCHSVKQYVPTIYKEKFPDLILGDAEGASASPTLIDMAYKKLGSKPYSLSHNYPFMGGFITREYGKPLQNQQALQLEMSKMIYMDESEKYYDPAKAESIRSLLSQTLNGLGENLLH